MKKKQVKEKNMELQKKRILLGAAVFVIVALIPIYFMFFRDSYLFKVGGKWHLGASGYREALHKSRIYFKPILIVVNENRCRQCELLQSNLWDNQDFQDTLTDLLLVQLNISNSVNDLRIAKQLGYKKAPYVALLLKHNSNAVPLYILPDLNSIWVPSGRPNSGHYVPLSPASFRLAMDATTEHTDVILLEKNN